MEFPHFISLTVTNTCNLTCRMCTQRNGNRYIKKKDSDLKQEMELEDWKQVIDELEERKINGVLLRGGEPFLFPDIIELITYLTKKKMFVSINTNGTLIKQFARIISEFKSVHLTFLINGPEKIHDHISGVKGTFSRIRDSIIELNKWEEKNNITISKLMSFTISDMNYRYLGQIPSVAKSLNIPVVAIVPCFFITKNTGRKYERVMMEELDCKAYSWEKFHKEVSGIDFKEFREQYNQYLKNLNSIHSYPYMPLSEGEFKIWFENDTDIVGMPHCQNIEELIDIQPTGEVNFCVDAPDYSIGNVKKNSIVGMWNSKKAEKFREYRRNNLFPVCFRCVAKYMSVIQDKDDK